MLLYQSIVKKQEMTERVKKTSSCIQEETEYGEKKESKEKEQEVSGK